MPITQYSKIQHRRGLLQDLPFALNTSELGHAIDQQRLFIGNGNAQDGAPYPGNTEIITNSTLLNNPRALEYVYQSNTLIQPQTGPTANAPTIRSVGQILDDFVSVKSFGAQGDGISDDTAAIQRALDQIYCQLIPGGYAQATAYRQIYFPAGVYNISDNIYFPPYANLVGDGPNSTIIKQTNVLATSVVRTEDSLTQKDIQLGTNSATLPINIQVFGITFQHVADADVVKLERANNVYFENCAFVGNWTGNVLAGRAGIRLDSLGTVFAPNNIRTRGCAFLNVAYAFNSDLALNATQIYFDFCNFDMNLYGVWTSTGMQDVKVSNSSFNNITRNAIYANPTSNGVGSVNNSFRNSGLPGYEVIKFDNGATNCSSIGDKFTDNIGLPIGNFGFGSVILSNSGNFVLQNLTTTPVKNKIILLGNTASSTATAFAVEGSGVNDLAKANTYFIDYTLVRSGNTRIGTIYILSDGTVNGTIFNDVYSETAPTGIDFDFAISSNHLTVNFTSTPGVNAVWTTQTKAFFTPLS